MISMRTVLLGLVVIAATSRVSMLVRLMGLVRLVTITVRVWVLWYIGTIVMRVLRDLLRRVSWMRLGSIIVRVTRYALRWVSRVRLRAIVMRVSWDINGLANALVLRLMVISTVTVGVGVRMIRAMS